MAVESEELRQVYNRLQGMGYYAAVFDFNFLTRDGREPEQDPARVHVIVTNTETNASRTYNAADGHSWTDHFINDIRAGVYGPPPRGVERPYNIAPGHPST